MKIVDINNTKINAAFVFMVGNCEISVSTIMNKKNAEICIFEKGTDTLLKDEVSSIQEAISWVSMFGPRD